VILLHGKETMEIIQKYFPDLPDSCLNKFEKLDELYAYWNTRINLISRKDIQHLYLHHVLHSLAIPRHFHFKPGTRILDAGTGGGFPGIPLAIYFPDVEFTLADSIGKKVKVVKTIAKELALENVNPVQSRVECLTDSFEFVVCRAVTSFPVMVSWIANLIGDKNRHTFPNGLIFLKGGDLKEELGQFMQKATVYDLYELFPEPYFDAKKMIFLPGDQCHE